jgi:hypothetical protein
MNVPEAALFWPFFFGFFAYHAWIQRAWRKLEVGNTEASTVPALDDEEVHAPG